MARVALIGENSIEYIDKLIDIWNSGDCAVLIDWRIPFSTAIEMMNEADVKKCVIQKGLWDESETKKNLFFEVFEKNQKEAQFLPISIYEKFLDNYSRNEAVIIYSSGTTGKSKGIILSHYAINTNADSIIDYMMPSSNDCIYIAKTLSHSSTITGELLVALKTKMKIVVAPIIVPPRIILKNINKFDVTIICLNPTLLRLISEEQERHTNDIRSLQRIYVSGSILNDKIYELSHKVFNNIEIYNVYGLSEAGPRVSAQTKFSSKNNSVGKAIKNVEIKVLKEDGSEAELNENGIVHVKTQCLFDGYVTGNLKFESLYDDWLNTGDVGYIDDEKELHIVERIDDVIILDSHKIYPRVLETLINNFSQNINDCLVFKNIGKQQEIILCVYDGKEIESRQIINYLRKKTMEYEIPKKFIKISSIIYNSNGKKDRKKTIEKYQKEFDI